MPKKRPPHLQSQYNETWNQLVAKYNQPKRSKTQQSATAPSKTISCLFHYRKHQQTPDLLRLILSADPSPLDTDSADNLSRIITILCANEYYYEESSTIHDWIDAKLVTVSTPVSAGVMALYAYHKAKHLYFSSLGSKQSSAVEFPEQLMRALSELMEAYPTLKKDVKQKLSKDKLILYFLNSSKVSAEVVQLKIRLAQTFMKPTKAQPFIERQLHAVILSPAPSTLPVSSIKLFAQASHHQTASTAAISGASIYSAIDSQKFSNYVCAHTSVGNDQGGRLQQYHTALNDQLTQYNQPADVAQLVEGSAWHWKSILSAIQQGNWQEALHRYESIVPNDPIMSILASAHEPTYIIKMLIGSLSCTLTDQIYFKKKSSTCLSLDLSKETVIDRHGFALMIAEASRCAHDNAKVQISAGLPCHHHGGNNAQGFCIYNGVAMQATGLQQKNPGGHLLIIGFDVNEDDFAWGKFQHTQTTHIDVFDRKVYPRPYNEKPAAAINCTIKEFHLDNESLARVTNSDTHPAITYILKEAEAAITQARDEEKTIDIMVLAGLDSSQREKAGCSQTKQDRMQCRFNDNDYHHYIEGMERLLRDYNSTINRVIYRLEGGYSDLDHFSDLFVNMASSTISAVLEPKQQVASSP